MTETRTPERVIVHLDMDAFYAAVEVREDPALRGKPLIIGHRGRRGVVSTCSYEARKFGVHSAMPSLTAERLCPQAVWLPGRMSLYVEVSRQVRAILDAASPVVEPLSIDEAFLDLAGIAKDLAAGREVARRIKERIRKEQGLSASAGVAPNKFLAKIASDLEKPDGLVVFPLDHVPSRLHPMAVERLWGVGPKTGERLRAAGIATIGDLLAVAPERLERTVGAAAAAHFRALAAGQDERPVVSEHAAKSISEERTYERDLRAAEDIDRALLARAEGVARELRRQGLVGRTVHLKVRSGDFQTWTRALTLAAPTDLAQDIVAAARALFAARIVLGRQGVRLLGVGLSALEPRGSGQQDLFPDPGDERAHRLAAAADALCERFGSSALRPAALVEAKAEKVRGQPGGQGRERRPGEASSLPTVD